MRLKNRKYKSVSIPSDSLGYKLLHWQQRTFDNFSTGNETLCVNLGAREFRVRPAENNKRVKKKKRTKWEKWEEKTTDGHNSTDNHSGRRNPSQQRLSQRRTKCA